MNGLRCIAGVLNDTELQRIRQAIECADLDDGAVTAGFRAKRVKNNRQVRGDWVGKPELNQIVLQALTRNETFQRVVIPRRVCTPLFSSYTEGMSYGPHVDDALMRQGDLRVRSDVATTVFLSHQDEYEGGELVIGSTMGEIAVKLPAGEAVVYSAATIHRVNPVIRGKRLAAVTWAESHIRDPARRELLAELDELRLDLHTSDLAEPQVERAFKIYANLLRMWSET